MSITTSVAILTLSVLDLAFCIWYQHIKLYSLRFPTQVETICFPAYVFSHPSFFKFLKMSIIMPIVIRAKSLLIRPVQFMELEEIPPLPPTQPPEQPTAHHLVELQPALPPAQPASLPPPAQPALLPPPSPAEPQPSAEPQLSAKPLPSAEPQPSAKPLLPLPSAQPLTKRYLLEAPGYKQ
ncbi:hypothetical protein FF38_10616 [Lucilia cuprina]|uniref:Uncharacterized protein n=1 Tax=Lucilia cuprina TaxID=7375 RepID=A0A0L0BX48_LUCCU|nr:hypothetical protein FF38_10616 [Lucilia cuprina]